MRYFIRLCFGLACALLYLGAGTKEIKLTEGIQPGNLAPEIHLQGVAMRANGYVLVQFWGAYNPQSRVLNTQMHNAISQSKAENLQLVSISLDENPAVFKGVIKADHLDESTQWNETEGKHSEVFKKYRLKSGCSNWLIDSKGMIVARNLRPSEVIELIAK
ncbi:MAG: hypothetical protein EZS26_002464 [Candidatus Ordinivivax streblomastigis]|uniref:Thioredoxin-like fold domain-containing protein n=1 Tax=Candidatus Ordinivivax streblomastigis TaxID=2540710 RepID=A0A5M8NZ02_9BACT|nr:MAG: hypothetical protein EZS26_002464 [Candidatus Ordinivivax streblomastigis]